MSKPRPITDHSRLSINTATTRAQWNLSQAIDGYARAGVGGISPWRDQIAEMGLAKAAKAIRDAELTMTGVCRGGMFPWMDEAGGIEGPCWRPCHGGGGDQYASARSARCRGEDGH